MGTEVSVALWVEDPAKGREAIAAVMQDMRAVDSQFSPYISTSELAQINKQAAQKTLSISAEMAFLIDKSLYYSALTQGAFDITFASVGWFTITVRAFGRVKTTRRIDARYQLPLA